MRYTLKLLNGASEPIVGSNVIIYPADSDFSAGQAVSSDVTNASGTIQTTNLDIGVMYAFTESSNVIGSGTFFASALGGIITLTPTASTGTYPGSTGSNLLPVESGMVQLVSASPHWTPSTSIAIETATSVNVLSDPTPLQFSWVNGTGGAPGTLTITPSQKMQQAEAVLLEVDVFLNFDTHANNLASDTLLSIVTNGGGSNIWGASPYEYVNKTLADANNVVGCYLGKLVALYEPTNTGPIALQFYLADSATALPSQGDIALNINVKFTNATP